MPREIRSAVVTGPTGAVGTALCRLLVRKNITVYAVCRPGSPRAAALPQGVNVLYCDLSDIAALPQRQPALRADAWFHLGWAHTIGAGRNDMPAQIENIRCTVEAAKAAAAIGCGVFLGAGSQAEYGRAEGLLQPGTPCFPENGYGMAKLCAGQMSRTVCAQLGIDHVWLRILSVYGPGDGPNTMISSVIRALLAGETPALTPGGQLWDYLYSDDAASALLAAAQCGKSGSVYPLGSGTARPLREYVEALRDAVDPSLPLGFGQRPYAPQQVMHLQADISALTADTGFLPAVPFSEGIRTTVQWMKEHTDVR